MSKRKPISAPLTRNGRIFGGRQTVDPNSSTAAFLAVAGMVGLIGGLGSIAINPESRSSLMSQLSVIADKFDGRQRKPQPGDYWDGCNTARAAGTAPIYRGEPGYREGMDGDNDGVACEPYRGL